MTLQVCPIPLLQRIESARAHEANLSAEPHQAIADSWFPGANEDSLWTSRPKEKASEGAEAPGRQRCLEVIVGQGTGRFGRSDRLLEARDFARLSSKGSRTAAPEFVVLMSFRPEASPLATFRSPRLGLSTPRRVGNAVVRNYIKRSVREWFRNTRDQLAENTDLVVIARPAASKLSAPALGRCLDGLMARQSQTVRRKGSS